MNGRNAEGFTADVAAVLDSGPILKRCRGCNLWKSDSIYSYRMLTCGRMLRICRRCEADRAKVRREQTSLGQRNRDRIRARYWADPEAAREAARQRYHESRGKSPACRILP